MANIMDDDLLGSDSEDDDYVPSGAEGDSDEENSGEEEDLSLLDKDGAADTVNAGKGKRNKKKKSKGADGPRKRTGGIKLENDNVPTNGVSNSKDQDNYNKDLAKQIENEKEEKKKDEEKKKAESLWSDFMKDVGGPKPKPKVTSSLGSLASLSKSSPKPSVTSTSKQTVTSANSTTSSSTAAPSKVTITKEYDFAGETVKVTKEVSADSKEAKAEQKKQEEKTATKPTAGPSLSALGIGGAGMKRPGGLGSVLGKLGKKQKISTLDKSKLDWDNFKHAEGISEELSTHNKGKDGYIERQQFLQRTDLRQFEREKEMRIKNRKPFLS